MECESKDSYEESDFSMQLIPDNLKTNVLSIIFKVCLTTLLSYKINYEKFRKAMYPNLIFFYGPIYEQNLNCAHAMANQVGYLRVELPPNANSFIK